MTLQTKEKKNQGPPFPRTMEGKRKLEQAYPSYYGCRKRRKISRGGKTVKQSYIDINCVKGE